MSCPLGKHLAPWQTRKRFLQWYSVYALSTFSRGRVPTTVNRAILALADPFVIFSCCWMIGRYDTAAVPGVSVVSYLIRFFNSFEDKIRLRMIPSLGAVKSTRRRFSMLLVYQPKRRGSDPSMRKRPQTLSNPLNSYRSFCRGPYLSNARAFT